MSDPQTPTEATWTSTSSSSGRRTSRSCTSMRPCSTSTAARGLPAAPTVIGMSSENRELVKALSGYPTFRNCSKDDLEALVEAGGPFSLPSGWPMVQEGIPADACYVLTEGDARVFHQREEIATISTGDLVGEMALLDGGQRNATVTSS